jgi:hypothetical protein
VEHIVKALRPVAVLVSGIVVFVLGTAFVLAADATLASASGASGALADAGRWLQFLGAGGAFGAVCLAGWAAVTRSAWVAAAEIAVVALGALLLTVGFLASAASGGSSSAAPVTGAVGIGLWALLALSRAARANLAEQASSGAAAIQSDLWLGAAGGLFALAIGYGITAAAGSAGAGVAGGVLEAIGAGGLTWAIVTARTRRLLDSKPVPSVLAGLVLLAASFLAAAVVAGLAFGTASALSIALTVVTAVELAAIVALGLAAWTRVAELYH